MFYVTKEGEDLKNGFNFYPWSDTRSFGVRFKLGSFYFRMRYSKLLKQWIVRWL